MNYLRCCAGSLAMNLFVRLYADSETHFFAPLSQPGEKEKFPDWQKQMLIREWNSESAVSSAFDSLYDISGLSWSKKIHIRKNAMEHGSTRGELPTHQLSTMLKHKTNKNKIPFYEMQLFPPVMRVMCGLKQQGCYFCPRTRVFPFNELQGLRQNPNESLMGIATRLIFPKWPTWIQQRESRNGDQTKCLANFLYELLPWLTAIVIQDGIYWIVDFPSHEVSRLLLHAMPPWYPRWAASARRECATMTANQERDKINAMNEGSQAAFALLMDEIKHMRRDFLQLREENKLLRQEMQLQAAEYKRCND
jgi:hypothetical protein